MLNHHFLGSGRSLSLSPTCPFSGTSLQRPSHQALSSLLDVPSENYMSSGKYTLGWSWSWVVLPKVQWFSLSAVVMALVQFSSVAQSCPTLWDPMNCSTPGLPVHHQLPGFTQTHAHRVSDAIQPSHPLSSPSPPALNPSQHQGLFKWVRSLHQVAKVLEFQLQLQSFQWTPRTDLL